MAGFAAGFGAGASYAGAPPVTAPEARTPKVAVVVNAGAPSVPRIVTAARAGAEAARVTHRAPRSVPEQLSVTARLAAEGYTAIVGVGLDRSRAIDPLDGRVAYVAVPPAARDLPGAVAAQARRAAAPEG